MKFRKKPIVVDAFQFMPRDKRVSWPDGVKRGKLPGYEGSVYYLDTLEGRMRVSPGDWIITGIVGEKYCCNALVFSKTYERVVKGVN
jgi:hypothetical protein